MYFYIASFIIGILFIVVFYQVARDTVKKIKKRKRDRKRRIKEILKNYKDKNKINLK